MRVIGDVVFSIGVLALGWFVLGLATGRSFQERELATLPPSSVPVPVSRN